MDEQYIIQKIKELLPDSHHIPQGVLYAKLKTEIQKDVSSLLSNLFKSGKITYRKTISDILINVTNE